MQDGTQEGAQVSALQADGTPLEDTCTDATHAGMQPDGMILMPDAYRLINVASNKAIGADPHRTSTLVLEADDGQADHLWIAASGDEPNELSLLHLQSAKYLSSSPMAVQLGDRGLFTSWKIAQEQGGYSIRRPRNGECLSVDTRGSLLGPLRIKPFTGAGSQKWLLRLVKTVIVYVYRKSNGQLAVACSPDKVRVPCGRHSVELRFVLWQDDQTNYQFSSHYENCGILIQGGAGEFAPAQLLRNNVVRVIDKNDDAATHDYKYTLTLYNGSDPHDALNWDPSIENRSDG